MSDDYRRPKIKRGHQATSRSQEWLSDDDEVSVGPSIADTSTRTSRSEVDPRPERRRPPEREPYASEEADLDTRSGGAGGSADEIGPNGGRSRPHERNDPVEGGAGSGDGRGTRDGGRGRRSRDPETDEDPSGSGGRGERQRRPERTRRAETREDDERSERPASRGAVNPNHRAVGPHVTATGRVLSPPNSKDVPRPSLAPIAVGVVLIGIALAIPFLMAYLTTIVVVTAVILFLMFRLRVRMFAPGGRGGRERPKVMVTTFTVGVSSPTDEARIERRISCRLVTKAERGHVDFASGDIVTVSGWQGLDRRVEVDRVVVPATRAVTRRDIVASAGGVAITTLLLIGVTGLLAWLQRRLLEPADFLVVKQQFFDAGTALLILVVALIGIWIVAKAIFRRF